MRELLQLQLWCLLLLQGGRWPELMRQLPVRWRRRPQHLLLLGVLQRVRGRAAVMHAWWRRPRPWHAAAIHVVVVVQRQLVVGVRRRAAEAGWRQAVLLHVRWRRRAVVATPAAWKGLSRAWRPLVRPHGAANQSNRRLLPLLLQLAACWA